jgi:hypothetical protein
MLQRAHGSTVISPQDVLKPVWSGPSHNSPEPSLQNAGLIRDLLPGQPKYSRLQGRLWNIQCQVSAGRSQAQTQKHMFLGAA